MRGQKIDFIVAYNDERFFQECRFYVEQLIVPEGYEAGMLGIVEGKSMAAAYNEGMNASDAKYKVYLHQDVFILNKNFIADILAIFQNDAAVGMIGVLGGIRLPDNGCFYDAWNVGRTKVDNGFEVYEIKGGEGESGSSVEAIDGMLMATQYDLPWREDLFAGWDFYDASQSFEFRRRGYRIVVPRQAESWCFHDIGCTRTLDYDQWRLFCLEYLKTKEEDILPREKVTNPEKKRRLEEISGRLLRLVDRGAWKGVAEVVSGFDAGEMNLTELRILKCICEIYDLEVNDKERDYSLFTEHGQGWGEICGWYKEVVFWARRIEQGYTGEAQVGELMTAVRERQISWRALSVISRRAMFVGDRLVDFLEKM